MAVIRQVGINSITGIIMLMRGLKRSHSGATSLIIVLIVGMILMVMVGGIAALTLREQRQATNVDQSNRALQTAEAGVKFAVQRVIADPAFIEENIDECGEDKIAANPKAAEFLNIFPAQTGQQITCVFVGNKLKSLEGSLQKDQATQVLVETPASALGPYYFQLRWHSDTLDSQLANYSKDVFYPDDSNYNAAAAPEVTFVRWPKNSFSSSQEGLPIETVFFMPGQADKSGNNVMSGCNKGAASDAEKANYGEYRCVTNPSSNVGFNINQAIRLTSGTSSSFNFAIRIKPRYADTHYQLRIFDESGQELTMQSSNVMIDITARSGDLYRRIRAEKPITPTALENLFDSVLFGYGEGSDSASRDICKGLVVRSDFTLAPAQNPSCKQYP